MILCVGEILVDNINGEMHPGGAPFNVANQISKLNASVAFVGSVGNDLPGKFLLSFSQSHFNGISCIETLEKETTQAIVTIDKDKDRYFSFYRNDTADSYLNIKKIKELSLTSSIVHFGSLALTNSNTRNEITNLIKELKKDNKTIAFDVNYRKDIFENINVLKSFITYVDILKLSLDELELFTNIKIETKVDLINSIKKIALNNQLVIVTLGNYGSCYYKNNEFNIVSSIKVNPIDTTGAGDAFFGAFLTKYEQNWEINEILKYANICAALSTESYGAIESQVNDDKILEYFN